MRFPIGQLGDLASGFYEVAPGRRNFKTMLFKDVLSVDHGPGIGVVGDAVKFAIDRQRGQGAFYKLVALIPGGKPLIQGFNLAFLNIGSRILQ